VEEEGEEEEDADGGGGDGGGGDGAHTSTDQLMDLSVAAPALAPEWAAAGAAADPACIMAALRALARRPNQVVGPSAWCVKRTTCSISYYL